MQSTVRYQAKGQDGMTHDENAATECIRRIKEQPTMEQAIRILRAYAEEARREEREAWIAALCPHCNKGHILDNGRVWAFCGARKAMPGIPEEVIAATIRAQGEK